MKKMLMLLLFIYLICFNIKPTTTITIHNNQIYNLKNGNVAEPHQLLFGDLNNNNHIDLSDVISLLKIYIGTDETYSILADFNKNNKVDLQDVITLLKIYLGLADAIETEAYIVTFNTDGGLIIQNQFIPLNGKVIKPENPTKTGYTFVEWQLNEYAYNFNTPVTSDLELTAYWEIKLSDTINVTPKTVEYTGENISANEATNGSGRPLLYEYYNSSNCSGSLLEGPPKNAGNYSVKITSEENETYLETSVCIAHTINKAETSTTLDNQIIISEVTSDEITGIKTIITNSNDVIENGSYTYNYYSNNTCTNEINKPTIGGYYYIIGTFDETNNFNSSKSECVKYTYGNINDIMNDTIRISYDLFDIKGDGITNDYNGIKQAHDFVNDIYLKTGEKITIYADNSKSYYISVAIEPIDIITNVDFQNAHFILDDYIDLNNDDKNDTDTELPLFNITNPFYVQTKKNSNPINYIEIKSNLNSVSISTDTNNLIQIKNILLNNSTYINNSYIKEVFDNSRYWGISVTNSNKQYIRIGNTTSDNGYDQTDLIIIDSTNGNVVSKIDWNYNDIRSIKIFPIPNEKTIIKNGYFLTRTNNRVFETSQTNKYSNRNIYINYTGNVELTGINHDIDEETHSYTSQYQSQAKGNLYFGFIKTFQTAFIKINNTNLTSRTYVNGGTYDLTINSSVNVFIDNLNYYCDSIESNEDCYNDNILDNSKWGIMNSNNSKSVFITNSVMNRIDAHRGITDLYVNNVTLGVKGLTITGQGKLYVGSSTVDYANTFLTLRNDYGSTFDGDIVLEDNTYIVGENNYPYIIYSDNLQNHDFGYTTYFPNLYIDGLTIDNSKNSNYTYLTMIRLNMNVNLSTISNNISERYYLKPYIYMRNISNTKNVNLFRNEYINNKDNLTIDSYGGNNEVTINVDNTVHIHSQLRSVDNPKYSIDDNNNPVVISKVDETKQYFNSLWNSINNQYLEMN